MNEAAMTSSTDDEATIRDLYERMMDGWNRGSGEAFAEVFAEDGDQVAFDGTHFAGRREISDFHQELFDKWLKGTRLVGLVESVRFPVPDAAVAHARGGIIMRGKSEPSPERDSIQTLIAVRRNGEWRLAALDNIRVRPITGSTFPIWAITDFLWKVFGGRKSGSRAANKP